MDQQVRDLFRELADMPAGEREKILAQRDVSREVRSEVESLLGFDQGEALTGRVSQVAAGVLSDAEPRRCGAYKLIRLIGSGGMGSVYLADRGDGEIEQRAAVKLLRMDVHRPADRERFLRERQILALLNHPSIARVLDAGHTGHGQPYLVMEFVDGLPIDEYAQRLPLGDKLQLVLKVCDAVSYAHRQLMIHRDIKPSNILVTSSGQPKLLDFGIAKLLDDSRDLTATMERFLTPAYASPEQRRGEHQTTATDIYSLGAVLHKILVGKAPGDTSRRSLPKDLDAILRKALREEAGERYATVDALAADLRAFLDLRPVDARAGDTWYRMRKFVRRYWIPVAAAALILISISGGLFVANRQRAIAQRRFEQVRTMANKVLAVDARLQRLDGATEAREDIVAISQAYLEALRADAGNDQDLALEAGLAYVSLSEIQGVPSGPNLGRIPDAQQSLVQADRLLERVLAGSPANRVALLASADVAHYRMMLFDTVHAREDAGKQAEQAALRTEAFLQLGDPDPREKIRVIKILNNVALYDKNAHHYEKSARQARRGLQIAGSNALYRASLNSLLADDQRFLGDLSGALQSVTEAVQLLDGLPGQTRAKMTGLISALWRQGVILGQSDSISLERPRDAILALQRSLDLCEAQATVDSNDAFYRINASAAARELGPILDSTDPQRALEVYEHGLRRIREVKSVKARREEANLLAGSAYALRHLRRIPEARKNIDDALQLLRATKDYPAGKYVPGDEADTALRALGDHLAETGQPEQAMEVYADLLPRILATEPDPMNDLRQASNLSRLFVAFSRLARRVGQPDQASAKAHLSAAIWKTWDRKLPGNPYIQKQLALANSLL